MLYKPSSLVPNRCIKDIWIHNHLEPGALNQNYKLHFHQGRGAESKMVIKCLCLYNVQNFFLRLQTKNKTECLLEKTINL